MPIIYWPSVFILFSFFFVQMFQYQNNIKMKEENQSKVLQGGEFLIRQQTAEEVFTPEDLNEEQIMMAQAATDFLNSEVHPAIDKIDKQEDGITPRLLEQIGQLGLMGVSIPEEYGGLGADFNTHTAITFALGPSYSFGVSLAAHTGIGTLPILYFGTEAQKKHYLPKLASGELKAAYCLTEPGSGSDALAAKARADLSKDGKHYILNGQKMWITNGGFADVFIVFAQVDGDKFSGFVVDADTTGVTRGEEENKMGIKGSSTCQVFFENVQVPVENILGEVGKGHKIAFNILNIGRYKLCAMVLGGAKRSTGLAVKYANERIQFKVPISSFGAIQHKLAEMAIKTWVGEAATYRVSNLIQGKIEELKASGIKYEDALMGAAEEYAIECAMLKVVGSEALDYVVDEMVQVFGGYGYSEEYPASRAYRDSRINRIFEGTNEINRLLTFDMLFKRALKGKLNMMAPAMAVQKELMSIPDFSEQNEIPFGPEFKAVENMKKSILMVAGAAASKLAQNLEQEQEIVMNIADMLIETFNAESALLRAAKLTANKGAEESKYEIAIMRVNLADSIEQLSLHGKHAIVAFTEGDELRMMLLGLKRFTKFDPINTKNLRREIAARLIEANDYCF